MLMATTTTATEEGSVRTLFDFTRGEDPKAWQAVNDGVMGGLSQGAPTVKPDEGVLQFAGTLSLQNNGGFSSIRSRGAEMDLADFEGVSIRYRGDGRQYAFTVGTDFSIMAGSYRAELPAVDGAWVTVKIPFADFEATSFGRQLRSAPALNRSAVRSVGFILADKQAGPFQLQVDSIEAYRDPRPESEITRAETDSPAARAQRLIELAIQRGVPMYNHGNPTACAAVYEVTAHALVAMAENLPEDENWSRMDQGLRALQGEHDMSRRAWALRQMLDDAYRSLRGAGAE